MSDNLNIFPIAHSCNSINNTCIPDDDLLSLSYGHGTVYTAPANCSCPRRASGHRDAELCGQRLLPSRISLPSGTPHKAGAYAGTAFWLSAMRLRSLYRKQTVLPPDVVLYAVHSTSVLTGPERHIRDACRGLSVS